MASNLKIRKKSIRLEAQEQARNKNQSETVSKDDRSGGKIVLRKSLPRKSKLKKVLGVEEKGDIKEEILAIINHVIENVVASSDLKVSVLSLVSIFALYSKQKFVHFQSRILILLFCLLWRKRLNEN